MKNMLRKISSVLMMLLIVVSTLTVLAACSKNIVLSEFNADETYFIVGEQATVTFTVEVSGQLDNVELHAGNDVIDKMHDDGLNGDGSANDGIYTCITDIISQEISEEEYYASSSESISNKIIISWFEKPSEESQEDVLDFHQEIEKIESGFVDSNGFVKQDEVSEILDIVGEYAKELYDAEELVSYEVTDSSVIVKWTTGLTSVYAPEVENTYSIASQDVKVSIYQPYFEWVSSITDNYIALPSNVSNEAELLEAAANDVANAFENTSSERYIDSEVSLSSVQNFGANQIILWQGHGVYGGSSIHSLICTGNDFDWNAWFFDIEYFLDCCQDRIVEYGGNETFSSKYIDKYCPDIDNSLVYLGPCQSGYDSVLAEAFLNKGADAVIANTETILCLYGDMIQYTTVHLLSQVNMNTGNYYTLNEALEEAKTLYGNNDEQYGGEGAEPVIFGGEDANNYRLGDYVPNSAQDFTIPAEMVVTLGEIDVIEPVIEPEEATDYIIKWSSSDESVATVSPTGEAGIITALSKGNATITAELTSGGKTITKTTNLRVASKARDTVLVLDISGSMSGEPLEEMKKSAIQFCNNLLTDEYNNRVGLVFYDDEIYTIDLTDDLDMLISYIEGIDDGGLTNMEAGLTAAYTMLQNYGNDTAIRNVVVMADGLPNDGKTSDSGSMPISGYYSNYTDTEYANAVIDTAQVMMNSYNMYSLGFFHGLYGESKDFAITLMQQLTNQNDGYYQVDKAEDLQFAFGDISDEISVGSKIVINIACPVDVTVTYEGEKLSSSEIDYCDAASFGTLQLLGENNDIKVFSLDSDKEYEVEVVGTGNGTMDYSVNYYDETEQLTDYRTFESVPITTTTVIHSDTDNSTEDVSLYIDEDNDGETDTIWTAGTKSKGVVTYQDEPVVADEPVEDKEGMPAWAIVLIVVMAIVVIGSMAVVVIVVLQQRNKESAIDYHIPVVVKYEQPPVESDTRKRTEDGTRKIGVIRVTSGSMSGFAVPIRDGETLYLGKDAKVANIVFTKDYRNVSRMHCAVTFDAKANRYFVTDSSSNGTYLISKKRLIKGKRTPANINTVLILANDECTVLLG